MATVKINLKSTTKESIDAEANAITELHSVLSPEDLIGMAEFARKNPSAFGEIADTIRTKKWTKLFSLATKFKI